MDLKSIKMKRRLQDLNSWKGIIIAIIVISFMVTLVQYKKQQKLAPYQKTEKIEKVDKKKKEPFKMDSKIYTDEDLNFYLEVPKDWKKVTKDGFPTFVEQNSGAFIQIRKEPYNPDVNNVNQNALSGIIADKGCTMKNFLRKSANQYEVLYCKSDEETYDFVDEVFWDKENIVTIHMGFNDRDYKILKDIVDYVIKSFVWDSKNPIPKGYQMVYFPENFECLIPDGWQTGKAGVDYFAKNTENGAMLTIRAVPESYEFFNDLNANVASSLINQNKNDWNIVGFKKEHNNFYLKATYINGKVQRTNELIGIADGYYHILVLLDYETNSLEESVGKTLKENVRSFNKKEDVEKKKNERKENNKIIGNNKKFKSKNNVGKSI